MKPRRILASSTAALAAVLIASCSSAGTDSADHSFTTEPAPATEAAAERLTEAASEHPAAGSHHSDIDFTVDHVADAQHGVEVAVSFNVHRQAVNNDENVIRAISHAVGQHPDYDLIIVRGYSDAEMTDGKTQLIEAWYKPENVKNIDLENPQGQTAYEHCYSCSVNGQHRG